MCRVEWFVACVGLCCYVNSVVLCGDGRDVVMQ